MKIRTLFSAALVLFTLVGTGYAEAKTEKVLGEKRASRFPVDMRNCPAAR